MVSARHYEERCDGHVRVSFWHATLAKEIACASSRTDVELGFAYAYVIAARQSVGAFLVFMCIPPRGHASRVRHSLALPGDEQTSSHSIS
jgi:hypothetical protein